MPDSIGTLDKRVGLQLNQEQRALVRQKVIERTLEAEKARCKCSKELTLEVIINDAVYQEQERLRGEKPSKTTRDQIRFWSEVSHQFHSISEIEREALLTKIIGMYVDEIMGYFNPVIHGLATKIFPWGLKALLSRISPMSLLNPLTLLKYTGTKLNLEKNLTVTGPIESIGQLAKNATLIMAPTHVSNLDSVAIGLGLYMSKLPPFTYGAGLNLFSNPILSFFMNNLGAYKVDRRKKNGIYKSALKEYATLSMELGQHNLFFPGGTRCRSGEIEQHLKLGLLGCGIKVYVRNLLAKKNNPDLFIIPCTLSYGLVLEARSLIDDHLKETGKSRYIRIRNDFNRPMRVLNFWRNLQSMDSKIHLHFGEPLDLFGNFVNEKGESFDAHGRIIDRRKYVEFGGETTYNSQRDQEYTRELGRKILANFQRNNVVLVTHIVAFSVFRLLRRNYPQFDLYRILRTDGEDNFITKELVIKELEGILIRLNSLALQKKILLAEEVENESASEIFTKAMQHFQSFHDGEVLREKENKVYTQNMKLLFYYRNRLDHYGLDEKV